MKKFTGIFLAAFFSLYAQSALAQVCNDPSGFLKAKGEITVGNVLTMGEDCQSAIDGGISGGSVPVVCSGGAGIPDSTAILQHCINDGQSFTIPCGLYQITAALTPGTAQSIIFPGACVVIHQLTVGTPIFRINGKSNVKLVGNGAVLVGEGTFCGNIGQGVTAQCPFGKWSGNTNSEDRPIAIQNSTYVSVTGFHIRNGGQTQVYIEGGSMISVTDMVLEGTNLYSTPINNNSNTNFQNCILIGDYLTFGITKNVRIDTIDCSNTAMGILVETAVFPSPIKRSIVITNVVVHDIPAQHAAYIDAGQVSIAGWSCVNVHLACVKIQVGDSNLDVYGVVAVGVTAETSSGNCLEVAHSEGFGGSLNNVYVQASCNNVDRGIAIGGLLRNLQAFVTVNNATEAFTMQGSGLANIDLNIIATNINNDGGLINVTTGTNIRVRARITDPAKTAPGRYGIIVACTACDVTLLDPVITDSGANMFNALANVTAGGSVRVLGSALMSGATSTCVDIEAGTSVPSWPLSAVSLTCTGGPFTGAINITRSDLASGQVPAVNAWFGCAGSTIDFNGVTIKCTAGTMSFQSSLNGYLFDGNIRPISYGPGLGISTLGFAVLYMQAPLGGIVSVTPTNQAGNTAQFWPAGSGTLINSTTAAGGSLAGTYPNPTLSVLIGAGAAGSATVVPVISYNNEGRITAVTPTTITPAIGSVTGIAAACVTFLVTPSSANLRACLTDESGAGPAIFGTSPNITTPTGIVKGDVGLGNVDNTSDATKWAAVKTLTNTTYDTAGAGNSFLINGIGVTANQGTGAVVRTASPQITTPDIVGVANASNAAAGSVGEFVTATRTFASPLSMTTATAINIVTLALSAGDWNICGMMGIVGTATTNVTNLFGGISATTISLPTSTDLVGQSLAGTIFTNADRYVLTVPCIRANINASASYFLVLQSSFTISTLSGFGKLEGRRAR